MKSLIGDLLRGILVRILGVIDTMWGHTAKAVWRCVRELLNSLGGANMTAQCIKNDRNPVYAIEHKTHVSVNTSPEDGRRKKARNAQNHNA